MYLVGMDQLAREDIAAAAAVHQELGRDYDGAVAESLVERIGAEIDKRVDARLGRGSDVPVQRREVSQPVAPARPAPWTAIPLALGSITIGAIVTANINGSNHGNSALIAFIWIIIGVINVAYARRR
jgi:hypothetical protein